MLAICQWNGQLSTVCIDLSLGPGGADKMHKKSLSKTNPNSVRRRMIWRHITGGPEGDGARGSSADHQTERMTRRVVVDPPRDGFSVGARVWGDALAVEHAPRGNDALMSGFEVFDEDVEVHQPRATGCPRPARAVRARLEGQSLAMGWWFQRHPARVPLDRYAAQ
jgi:hypothetical protein